MGNLDAKRDWGMPRLRQGNVADAATIRAGWLRDTGETHSVREFLDVAFGYVNLNWQDYIEFDERYLRPSEVG